MKDKFRYKDAHSGKHRIHEFTCKDNLTVNEIKSLKDDHRKYHEMLSSMSRKEMLENF